MTLVFLARPIHWPITKRGQCVASQIEKIYVQNIYKRISSQSPLGMSFTANNPTLQLPLTNHFCVFMLGSQLWLANLAKLPLGPASRTLEIMKIKNHNNI